jgi:hypothetical protein
MRVERTLVITLALAVAFLVGRESVGHEAAAQRAPAFARFAFSGYHHDGLLVIDANGHGIEQYRPYINCTATILTACDKILGNKIFTGGFVRFTLKRIVGNKAYGTIEDSSLSWEVGATVTAVLKSNDTMTIYTPGTSYANCGPRAPAGYCGA